MKPIIIVGFTIINKLLSGEDVDLTGVVLIPDSEIMNKRRHYENNKSPELYT